MSPEALLRDGRARHEALKQYAKAHDRFAEHEQELQGRGKHIEAEGAHLLGVRILRSWLAEQEDPEPRVIDG
jgi:hypothetical protein